MSSKNKYIFFLLIFLLFIFTQNVNAQIVINEFSSSSNSDWVEIYNTSSNEIDLFGWSMKDTTSSLYEFSGEKIPAGGYCVQTVSNRLNNDGDRIQLFNSSTQIDCVSYGDGNGNFCGIVADVAKPTIDQTASRVPDGFGSWTLGISTQSSISCNSLIPTPSPTPSPTQVSTQEPTSTPTKMPQLWLQQQLQLQNPPQQKLLHLNQSQPPQKHL